MPVKKPTRKALAARRAAKLAARSETRKALMEALRAIREAKKSILKTGSFEACTFDITKYPPQMQGSPCKTMTLQNPIVLFPPHVPIATCKILRFPPHVPTAICLIPPERITRKDFERALEAIELWLRYLLKFFDKIYPKQR